MGLRIRITIAFVGGALAVSAVLSGTTYALTERYLYGQRIEESTRQAFGNVGFIVRYIRGRAGGEVSLAELVGLLEARGTFETLIVESETQWFAESVALTPQSVPILLTDAVRRGEVAYLHDRDEMVFGSPVPGHELAAFFFFSLTDLEGALTVLGRVLLGVSGSAVLLAALVGTRVSRRVVDPLRRASEASRRVAEGLLETRLPVDAEDELGTLAHSFNEMAAALEERIGRERRFVGDVSHELRTPLTTLRTSTEYLLQRKDELSPPLRRAVELLEEDLEYLQHLIHDLLDISRAEAGRVEMSWQHINLEDLTREVVARRARGRAGGVAVVMENDREALSTVADKQRLERIVGNLVDNALIHGDGSDVTVRLQADDGRLRLSVEDRGPGIAVTAQRRIFERFYKADPARHRRDGRGSGLGLAIARENAHLHGGEISVDSRPGHGSRFTLVLPKRDRGPVP
ncbi:MAG: HAMP domain-containing histidine kinase [Actinomycetota bacterium]|nr:HAMP domain-containing histidine kinase [Actinomycetota bacterium]